MTDKILEYQQVAALLSSDIDVLAKVAEKKDWDADQLREFIFRLKKNKDLLISDAKTRNMRYNAFSTISQIPKGD
jgi:predicted transcriptional regulator